MAEGKRDTIRTRPPYRLLPGGAPVESAAMSVVVASLPGMTTMAWLRRQAVGGALTRGASLAEVMARLEFVQADPIRAPAPAQDLILRQRVPGYRVGDLERAYPSLPLDEDLLYAYGFVTQPLRRVLHPRRTRIAPDGNYRPTGLAAEVLAFVRQRGVTHPRDAQAAFGRRSVTNGWGGRSAATTRALEELHWHGLVRVARRERGVRLYEPAPPLPEPLAAEERARRIALRVAATFAPLPEATFRELLRMTRFLVRPAALVSQLVDSGELTVATVDGMRYVWPTVLPEVPAEPDGRVRFLAPFDPVVWDRRRFAHLWGWEYRFEAYTPAAKRRWGYYALPLLWRDRVIGWVNCARDGETVEAGFIDGVPKSRRFAAAFDAEVDRLRTFLTPRGRSSATG